KFENNHWGVLAPPLFTTSTPVAGLSEEVVKKAMALPGGTAVQNQNRVTWGGIIRELASFDAASEPELRKAETERLNKMFNFATMEISINGPAASRSMEIRPKAPMVAFYIPEEHRKVLNNIPGIQFTQDGSSSVLLTRVIIPNLNPETMSRVEKIFRDIQIQENREYREMCTERITFIAGLINEFQTRYGTSLPDANRKALTEASEQLTKVLGDANATNHALFTARRASLVATDAAIKHGTEFREGLPKLRRDWGERYLRNAAIAANDRGTFWEKSVAGIPGQRMFMTFSTDGMWLVGQLRAEIIPTNLPTWYRPNEFTSTTGRFTNIAQGLALINAATALPLDVPRADGGRMSLTASS
ncbi:hypothetical protein HZA87_02775, partial [Candidatus Uhrbacteria bacterium]|nr:hypothetical protein [Candidatus Uhrbacteria bacterium]